MNTFKWMNCKQNDVMKRDNIRIYRQY